MPVKDDSKTASLPAVSGDEFQAVVKQIADYKNKESTLTVPEFAHYIDLLNQINLGPSNFKELQTQSVNKFKSDLQNALGVSDEVANQAAQRFIIERKTGEQNLTDFLFERIGGVQKDIATALGDIKNVSQYIPQGAGDIKGEVARVNTLYSEAQKSQAHAQTQAGTQATSEKERAQAQSLFETAQQELLKPGTPPFSPELSADVIRQLQAHLETIGETQRQNVEAGAAARGITGSSTEQFGLATSEKGTLDAIANTTLNFLLQSGQAGARNREFIIQQLQNQANALLGSAQTGAGLATTQDISQQGLDLQKQQLQAQIMQFNQQLQQQSSQFQQQLSFQQSQAAQDMQLLLQQLNKPARGSFAGLGAGLGGALGIGAGLALAPTGAGLPILAAYGAGGLGIGSLFGTQVGSSFPS